MENFSGIEKEDDRMEFSPGFRFHPSDEELIARYLSKKYLDNNFSARAIGESAAGGPTASNRPEAGDFHLDASSPALFASFFVTFLSISTFFLP
ncbi:hypothetical protein LguiA_028554 [Lonicera macranthoides]